MWNPDTNSIWFNSACKRRRYRVKSTARVSPSLLDVLHAPMLDRMDRTCRTSGWVGGMVKSGRYRITRCFGFEALFFQLTASSSPPHQLLHMFPHSLHIWCHVNSPKTRKQITLWLNSIVRPKICINLSTCIAPQQKTMENIFLKIFKLYLK